MALQLTHLFLIGLLSAGLLLLGCTTSNSGTDSFKIGLIVPLTATDLSEAGTAFKDGAVLAADEINQNGGINGKPVTIIIEDDQADTGKTVSAAQKLIQVDQINAVIIGIYGDVKATGPLFEQAHIPVITLWDSNPELDAMGEYIFGIGPWTPASGEEAATFSFDELQVQKAAIITDLQEWSLAVSDFFTNKFEEKGGQVVAREEIALGGSRDFRTAIAKVLAENPDVIYAPLNSDMSTFLLQLKQSGYTGKVISSDVISENTIVASQGAAEGAYETLVLDPEENAKVLHMKTLYLEKFGNEPSQVLFNAWGYDAVHLLAQAAITAQNQEQLKNNLYAVQGFEGASKIITFNAEGSSPTIPSIVKVENGQLVKVR